MSLFLAEREANDRPSGGQEAACAGLAKSDGKMEKPAEASGIVGRKKTARASV